MSNLEHGNIIHYDNPFLANTPESYYWLGWMFSDGSVYSKGHNHYVYLACKDLDILLKFKEFCGDRAKLSSFKYRTPVSKELHTIYKVRICSKELVEYFANTYGIKGKKSDTMNPDIEINWDLLRGAYDGDGSFKKGVVITSKSKAWIDKIASFYNKHNLHYTVIYDSAYRLAIYKKEDIKKVYHYLYDHNTLYLSRKKEDLSRLAKE